MFEAQKVILWTAGYTRNNKPIETVHLLTDAQAVTIHENATSALLEELSITTMSETTRRSEKAQPLGTAAQNAAQEGRNRGLDTPERLTAMRTTGGLDPDHR